ncbi:MAG: peptidase [Ferruginibacter sp.]|nr:peptidase [Ferruginibacter sp.]
MLPASFSIYLTPKYSFMHKCLTVLAISLFSFSVNAQETLGKLTVEKIMRDPKWIGSSPSAPFWGSDGKTLYFFWNPDKAPSDSIYYLGPDQKPVKASVQQKRELMDADNLVYNVSRDAYLYSKNGDIFYTEVKSGKTKRITQTVEGESNPVFSFNEKQVVYNRNQNLFAWNISTGETTQLTNIRTEQGSGAPGTRGISTNGKGTGNQQEDWLKNDQLKYFEVLRMRKEKREAADLYNQQTKTKELRAINLDDKNIQSLNVSPDGRYVTYRLSRMGGGKATIIPSYVTESGFTTDINGRTKVGAVQGSSEFFLYDRQADTVLTVKTEGLEGIKDLPAFYKDYPKQSEEKTKKAAAKTVTVFGPYWSPKGSNAILEIRSQDNKDRWIMQWQLPENTLKQIDHQHDEAWIGGPNVSFGGTGWINDNEFYYQSENTGYSHLYIADLNTGKSRQLTKGNYEVQQATLSHDKKYFYVITNEVHPGEQQFYRLNISSGKTDRITTMTGANQVSISPDEKQLAILYSAPTKPWELYLQENKPGSTAKQITFQARSALFNSYAWREPELISFKAADGADVYARVYKPVNADASKPAVLFVHGAGYLQNAHKWWSSYFREYMFNNLLADNGYYVMDIDYRGSAGYGRDWRTGIYRFMGGKDLTDNVDAVNYLVKNYGVNPAHVGLYGGSYGGFITLMGMFTKPDVFAAGAALRPVTDWANYNHGYTSNILNEPFNDSIAYHKSSPLYYAEGLKGNLLICHGMVDVNVHFQDAVKLSQRLIELGKDNWELAPYPMEDHGFVEPSSWTDEYKRIFKLFETSLKK